MAATSSLEREIRLVSIKTGLQNERDVCEFVLLYLLFFRCETVVMLDISGNVCCLQVGRALCIDEVAGFIVVGSENRLSIAKTEVAIGTGCASNRRYG